MAHTQLYFSVVRLSQYWPTLAERHVFAGSVSCIKRHRFTNLSIFMGGLGRAVKRPA